MKLDIYKMLKKGLSVLLFGTILSPLYSQTTVLEVDYPSAADLKTVVDGGKLSQSVMGKSSDSITVSSIEELRAAARMSGKIVTMTPGLYIVENTMPDDVKTIFHFSGSNNQFIFEDVTIQVPTEVLAAMGPGSVHEFAGYRMDGSNILFRGGLFENTGDKKPYKSLAQFEVRGNNIRFVHSKFIIRGSSPYGYGDMYGKGSGSSVALYKHSAMSILGDNVTVDSCDFTVHAYGHGIHIHGSQNTVLRSINMEGILRPTDEIYEETSGPAFDFDFTIQYPDWMLGWPIPKGEMLSLTEDGIRAYLDGTDVNGVSRRTGTILVENCRVNRMRGGITLAIQSGKATVSNCIVTGCDHAYSFASEAVVRNCKGDAAFGPLLALPYSNKRNSDIELELIPADTVMGTHPLAEISGSGHKITIIKNEADSMYAGREIRVGDVGSRYTEENSTDAELQSAHKASAIVLNNQTICPVVLTKYSSSCTVTSPDGSVQNNGTGNTIK